MVPAVEGENLLIFCGVGDMEISFLPLLFLAEFSREQRERMRKSLQVMYMFERDEKESSLLSLEFA
jgi:hypothetical protein